jgi:hypothetical protein
VELSLLVGALVCVAWVSWRVPGLDARVGRDVLLFALVPGAVALADGRAIGWRGARRAIRNAVALGLFVLPFYLVGSALPTVRAYYPMWGLDTAAPGPFLAHAAKQFVVVIAAETYVRGFLCVGVREIGFKSVFISPIVYAVAHATKPPIELVLSGPTDVLFGAVDYRSRSILPSVVGHGLGLVLLDWLVLHPPLLQPDTVAGWLSWLPLPL